MERQLSQFDMTVKHDRFQGGKKKKKKSSFKTTKANVNLKIKVGKLLKAFRGSSLSKVLATCSRSFVTR